MERHPSRPLGLTLLGLLATGCTGAGVTDDSGSATGSTFDVDLEVTEQVHNPLAWSVTWSTDSATTGTLSVDCGEDYDEDFTDSVSSTDHEVFVMGLATGLACEVAVEARDGSGGTGTAQETVTVSALPDSLPDLSVRVREPARLSPGWTLINLTNEGQGDPLVVALIDDQGRYRWFHDQLTESSGLDTVVREVEDGVLVGGIMGDYHPSILSWEGEVSWEAKVYMHHEIVPTEGGKLLFLGMDGDHQCPGGGTSNSVRELDPESLEVGWTWWICDHYQPEEMMEDWDHLNAIEPVPGEEAFIVSSRHQDALFKVSRTSGEVLWKLGRDGDFDLADRFLHQHAPELQATGSILLFDNGNDERPWSRLLELAIDPVERRAQVAWSYRPDPDIFGWSWGDADRLPNGNTLGVFGHVDDDARIHEVDTSGELLWDLVIPQSWGTYRAERVASPPVGWVVQG